MDMEKVKEYIENSATIERDELPLRFFEHLIMHGLSVDLIETGRVICSFKVPPRLLVIHYSSYLWIINLGHFSSGENSKIKIFWSNLSKLTISFRILDLYIILGFVYCAKNGGNYLHGGVTATLVDLVSSAAIYTVGATFPGTSVEINISFLDAAFADVSILSCF